MDFLYLFACHLEWLCNRDVKAYEELVAGLDSSSAETRLIAEALLRRTSPRPKSPARIGQENTREQETSRK